jgi:hypothetical protein
MVSMRRRSARRGIQCDGPLGRVQGVLFRPEMSDTAPMVPGMNEPLIRCDVTVTVARDGGYLPDPAELAVVAEQAHRAGPPAS